MNHIVAFPHSQKTNALPNHPAFHRLIGHAAPFAVAIGAGALVLSESLLPPHRGLSLAPLRYALAHYVTTPCGGLAVPLLWARMFARPLTGITPDSHPALWAEVAADLACAARSFRRWRFSLDDAITAARAAVREGASLESCAARGVVLVPAGGPAPRPIVADPVIHAIPIPSRTSVPHAA